MICFAPTEGSIPLQRSNVAEALEQPKIQHAGQDIVRQFDERLDDRGWVGGPSAIARFTVDSHQAAHVSSSVQAWPWLDVHYPSAVPQGNSGRVIICGLGIVRYWHDGPVPRYLLNGILESLVRSNGANTQGNHDVSN